MILMFPIKGLGLVKISPHLSKSIKIYIKCFCSNKNGNTDTKIMNSNDKNVKIELPEEPTTCCMSGCANCVWLDYAEKMTEYFKDGGDKAIKEINEKVNDPNIKAFLMQELRMRKKLII